MGVEDPCSEAFAVQSDEHNLQDMMQVLFMLLLPGLSWNAWSALVSRPARQCPPLVLRRTLPGLSGPLRQPSDAGISLAAVGLPLVSADVTREGCVSGKTCCWPEYFADFATDY